LSRKGSLFLTRPVLFHYISDRATLESRSSEVLSAVASGRLHVRIGETFPLADAGKAHEDLEGRKTTGKVLLLP
jgi:NADPH2:quinone reductase